MTDQIKNRVVGTIVIFSIAIIFLPDILDGKKQQLRDDFETIPVKPKYQSPDLSKATITSDNIKALTSNADDQNTIIDKTVVKKSAAQKSQSDITATAGDKSAKHKTEPTIVASSTAKPKPQPSNKASVKKTPAKAAWVITVGSFNDPKNVKSLLAKLRKNRFTAFSVPSRPRKGETSRVYVGPSFNKQSLVKLQPKLKAIIKESGYISSYNPVEK